jgi:hypothetical protein
LRFPPRGTTGGKPRTARGPARAVGPWQGGKIMGINRWSGGVEERKRNETDAKAGDEIPKEQKGDASSRVEASEGPGEDPEKREVVKKLEQRDSS